MKNYLTLFTVIILISPFPIAVNSVPTVSYYDKTMYKHQNKLIINNSRIIFENFAPLTIDSKKQLNGAWIEWRLTGAKVTEIFPTFTKLSELLNTTNNLRNEDQLSITTIYRGDGFHNSVTGFLYFENQKWSWDYWDITTEYFELIYENDIPEMKNRYINNFEYTVNLETYRPLDLVNIDNNHLITSFLYSSFLDHDIFNFNYIIESPIAYLTPLFRTNNETENTYNHIYYNGDMYGNNSKIPLTDTGIVNEEVEVIQGEPLGDGLPEPTNSPQNNIVTNQISYLISIVVGAAYYNLKYQYRKEKKREEKRPYYYIQ